MAAFPDPIAVSGCGCVSALGSGCDRQRQGFVAGSVNSVLGGKLFPASFQGPCFRARENPQAEYRVLDFSRNQPYGRSNRTTRLALTAIDEALAAAGLTPRALAGRRVGVALGTTVGCTFHNEQYYLDWQAGRHPDPAPLNDYLSANLSELIQNLLGIRGPRAVITNACASGTDAIGLAASWLANDCCDLALAGGADELSRVAAHGFCSLMLVSDSVCRPFDRHRRGLNLGEGAGILVLERESRVSRRQAEVRGWVRGYGCGGDAFHPTAPQPEGAGLQRAISKALSRADIDLEQVALINAHGTATAANDLAETRAVRSVGFDPEAVSMISTKGMTGHTLGAAGAIEAVFTLLALAEGRVYGTVGCGEPDPELRFPVVPEGAERRLRSRVGISQSLAFGGGNSALVLEADSG